MRTEFELELEAVRKVARDRHEKARRAAKARGRHDFPDLPWECSWAFEEELRTKLNAPLLTPEQAELHKLPVERWLTLGPSEGSRIGTNV